MRSFAIFLALILVSLAGIALLAYPVWQLMPAAAHFKFPRVASRVAMLIFFLGFIFIARRLRVADRASLGLGIGAPEFISESLKAFALGSVLTLPAIATMLALGMRVWKPGAAFDAVSLMKLLAWAITSGVVVALIEEIVMRGALHSAITRESGDLAAIVLVALVYSATHFFSRYRIPAAQVGPGSGVDMVFAVLSQPVPILDAFLCLTGVGILLGMVRTLTGNIAACVGLHAGWVTVILVVRAVSRPNPAGPAPWLLSHYDGFVGWLVLAWVVVFGFVLHRWYRGVAIQAPASSVHRAAQ